MNYDEWNSRGKHTSDGEPTALCEKGSRCAVFYRENRVYEVLSEKHGVVWVTIAESMDDAIRQWNANQVKNRLSKMFEKR